MTKAYTDQSERQRDQRIKDFQKRKERVLNDDIQFVMSSEQGRRFIYWLLWTRCGLMEGVADSSIKDGVAAAMHSWRREGQRDIAIDLSEQIKRVTLEKYVLMIKESTSALQEELLLEPKENES